MASRQSCTAVLIVASLIVSCLPSEELSSYSRGDSGGSGGMTGGGGSPQATPNPSPDGGPSEVEGPVARGLDASAAGGSATDGGGPGTPGGPATDAGSDASDSAPPTACGVSEVLGPNGNCFLTVATVAAWSDAQANCRGLGAGWDLAAVRSAEDTAFWAARLTFEVWVGASDAVTEGVWIWVSDGTQFWSGDGLTGNAVNGAYTDWNTDEPNGGENSDCARLLPRTVALPDRDAPWADLECTELLGALCEGPAE